MSQPDSHKLRFGPYRPPKVRRGDKLFCEIRGTVTVGGYSDGPISWPRMKKGGIACLILCGDLVRAVKREALIAVAYQWGVSETTVWKWRTALGVERWNEGSTHLIRGWAASRDDDRLERGRKRSKRPAALAKLSATRRGKVSRAITPLDGAQIEHWRTFRGLRRIELATKAGISNVSLWRLETGKGLGLSKRRAAKLAIALGVEIDAIAGDQSLVYG